MILRDLNSAMYVALLFAAILVSNTPFASSLVTCAAADEVPPDAQAVPLEQLEPMQAETPVPRQKVSLTPLLSLSLDARRIAAATAHAEEILQEEPSGVLFDVYLQFGPEDLNQVPKSLNPQFRMEIYTAYPTASVCYDTVSWATSEQVQEILAEAGQAAAANETPDGMLEQEAMSFVRSENYVAMRMFDSGVYTEDTASDLRKLLQQTEQTQASKAFSISCKPRTIARSAVKPFIDAQRALLATNSQQLDDEDSFSAVGRPLYYRMLNGLISAVFDDTESFEFSFDYSPNDRRSTVELGFTTAKGTEFDRYIGRLSDTRNRSLAYLHPEQTAFVSAAVPLPELLSSVLPQLSVEFLKTIQKELGVAVADGSMAGSIMSQFEESKQIDFLAQTVPTSADSQVGIFVLPLTSASSLESTSIQLAAHIPEQIWQRNVGEVAGFPIHKVTLDETEIFLTLTNDCVAAMIGPEESLSVLEKIVTRNFEQSPAANRFARTAFAIQGSGVELSKIGLQELPRRLAERLNDDGRSSLEDSFEFSLQTEPHQLALRATFAPDALMVADQTFELGAQLLGELLNSLD